ncbi:hypothetical protein, partial [Paenibacillus sp. P22]|uniref:hypothetical protein n=1 Tax=Paenibacillus sp. P22 TaxID=483908 RepID=UPI000431D87B
PEPRRAALFGVRRRLVEQAAAKNKAAEQGYELLVSPVDLDLTFTNSGKTARFGQLSGYAPK